MSSTAQASPRPFGLRFLVESRRVAVDTTGAALDPDRQVMVNADGALWVSGPLLETSTATNHDSRDDEGTDLW